MSNFYLRRLFFFFATFFSIYGATAQQLKVKDFAIWGGSSNASSYNKNQGVFFSSGIKITGSVGSTQQVQGKDGSFIKGDIVSGNSIGFSDLTVIQGNIIALKAAANLSGNIINSGYASNITGNVVANGKVVIKKGKGNLSGLVTGTVKVPAPTAVNYAGPTPKGGFSNTLALPTLPLMPDNTPFDGKYGTTNVTTTKTLTPGSYRTLSLTGNKTLTFSGPGNYIFYNVKNGGSNNLVFDLKKTTTGTINIFVVGDALWGKLSVRMINGNAPSRVFTEVHGNGSTNKGYAFDVQDGCSKSAGSGFYNWVGAVWAPKGGINIGSAEHSFKGFIHVAGALWSSMKVSIASGVSIVYQTTAVEQNFVAPYYPPPTNGKVATANNVIGAELQSLAQNPSPITSIPNNNIYRITGNTVLIDVISKVPNDATLRAQLVAAGMTGIVNNGPDSYVITGTFPIAQLSTLNTNSRIVYVRPCYPPMSNAGVTTQGDTTMRTYNVRSRFGLDGEGVKIGVLSDSYNAKGAAQHDIDEGDLPGIKSNGQANENPTPVQVLQDLPQKNDEGRAMLQIVHDIAPKAKLAFTTGFLTAGNFADGIKALASPSLQGGRCDVIVDDITYITEPFFRDGIVAKTVDEVVGQGVTYFSAAGNFGEKSYENNFQGVSNTAIVPAPATIHRFGTANTDIYQTLHLKPGTYTIVLQWTDNFYSLTGQGVQTDLDLYLLNSTGFTLFGFNRSNLFGDPFEVCPFTVTEETEAKLMIVKANATTANVRFKYVIFSGDGTIVNYQNGTSTIVGHANANSAIAVGAMLYANIPQYTPVYPSVASFSSRGGTFTYNSSNVLAARQKPDLIAPNGVNTTVNLGSPVFNDGDSYPNFFGTSAAAPHAAAAAALLIQAKKKYGLQTTVTPAEIRSGLQSSAGKLANQITVPSFTEGYGYVQGDSAVQQIANARPIINSWEAVVPSTQPGLLPFQVKVKGAYLTTNTKIYFNGNPLSTVVSPTKTEATATIPPIAQGDDPPLQLFNAAKSPSSLDGGLSEALHFFSNRVDVMVKAVDKTRKFGQQNPAFTSQVFVNGVPIENTTLTLADLKLDGENLTYSSFATTESTAGLYSITPSRSAPLNPNDPLLSAYSFTFVPGTLRIDKMPLKITPHNQVVTYGDFPNEITFDYEFDPSQPVSPTLLDYVTSAHKRYTANNSLIVMNGFETLAPAITASDLANTSTIASFQAIKNSRLYGLNNGQLGAVVNNVLPADIGKLRYLIDVSAQSFLNAKLNAAQTTMVASLPEESPRALLGIKALANGTAKASVPSGQLQPMVNGQLLAMVNGQLQAVVNGQLQAVVNNTTVTFDDLVFRNGQLLALVNGEWVAVNNGQLQAVVNGQNITVDLSVVNGQLQAMVNGQLMAMVNGQLQAMVNGQLLAMVNGQLQALVNGQLMPIVNGQMMAMVNGQLQPMVNGQLLALVNGQLMAMVNDQLEIVEQIAFSNGQLQALVNGQLLPLVNGQLQAMVNGVVTAVPNPTLVNGQLQALVNGQLQAIVNGQLQPIVNGQLQPIVNGGFVPVSSVKKLVNGQLQALVNDIKIPLKNGQLQAIVNGQMMAMVNGQLMAIVNGDLTFSVFQNGQLQALVNGQLQPMVNGQLQAIVNNSLVPVDNYSISNGQLQAMVNGQLMALVNNQLLAFANGQLQPMVNNFDVSGTANNAATLVLVDEKDLTLQGGAIGGMFSVNMVTGLGVGTHKICPSAFVDENFDVSYGLGELDILPRPLGIKADDATKTYGSPNPPFALTASGFSYDETLNNITPPGISTEATAGTGAGQYLITLDGGSAINYSLILQSGTLNIAKKALTVTADDKTKTAGQENPTLTVSYSGLVNNDTEEDICTVQKPGLPKSIHQLERTATYTNVKLNGGDNQLVVAPNTSVNLTADWSSIVDPGPLFCPACVTQNYIGIAGVFTDCHDVSYTALKSGSINRTFAAPATPGIYYITQLASWEYNCYDRGSGVNFDNNNAADAIAVLIVQAGNASNVITANTTANTESAIGHYPITITGCNSANYDITYVNGILSVIPDETTPTASRNQLRVQEENKNARESYLAPNPATNTIRVKTGSEVSGVNNVSVVDVTGRSVNVKDIKQITGYLFELNVSALPKGVYMVRVATKAGVKTFKFVKL